MNSDNNEGIYLAKMAITALLVALLVGAIVSLFYMLLTFGNAKYGSTKKAVETVNTEKLRTLQDQSVTADSATDSTKAHPLVSSVVSTLLEFDEKDIVYIYVTCRRQNGNTFSYNSSRVFTYNNVNFTSGVLSGLPGYTPSTTEFRGDTILSAATRYINQWAAERCHVSIGEVPYGASTLTGVCVEVLKE